MARRANGIKRQAIIDGNPLSSSEVAANLKWGEFLPIRGIAGLLSGFIKLDESHYNECEGSPESNAFMAASKELCFRFLIGCAKAGNGDKLRLLAAWVERDNPGPVDPLASILSYAIQCGVVGERIPETLARVEVHEIQTFLLSRGIRVDEKHIRKLLNILGVKRARGRPKKMRNSEL